MKRWAFVVLRRWPSGRAGGVAVPVRLTALTVRQTEQLVAEVLERPDEGRQSAAVRATGAMECVRPLVPDEWDEGAARRRSVGSEVEVVVG
jgi:hypothetical protein